jgi:hypothetical protein
MVPQKITKLVFVYNANSGKLNGYLDIAHKIFSPQTYPCSLCDITHGVFKEHEKWKNFRQNVKTPMEFLHLDEFKKEYASKFSSKFTFPIVLGITAEGWEVVVSTAKLDSISSEEELISVISEEVEFITID